MNIKNNWTGVGRISNDLEVKVTETGKHKLSFALAIDDGTKENPHTTFLPIDVWGNTADTIARYFQKGDQIIIGGRLSIRKYEDRGEMRNKITIVLESFEWGEKKKKENKNEPIDTRQDFYPSDVNDFNNNPWEV